MNKDRDDVVREIVRRDARYRPEGYAFLLEALDFTIQRRGKGRKHVSGPELLDGYRDFAVQQFGLLARAVLAEWGVTSTDDVGEMVFALIEEDLLQKTADDRREDFHALFDFHEAFDREFRATLSAVAI
jgi:uncharacterized repeat protein (TIGR04138 family)